MSEFHKYNPANMAPELLLEPPTQAVAAETRYLSLQLAKEICATSEKLRLGTELEIIFFSPDADPLVAYQRPNSKNPNYQIPHQDKMRELEKWANNRRSLAEGPHTKQSRLCVEFRTRPADIRNYFSRVNTLRDAIQTECRQLEVLPVVHSQHIHVSILDKDGVNPVEKAPYRSLEYATQKDFRQVLPLILLPEEIYQHWSLSPVNIKGQRQNRRDLSRLEFRKLSSEWACDPSLNALLSLRALKECLVGWEKENWGDKPKEYDGCFAAAAAAMRVDSQLKHFFGEATLETICDIVQHYPRVSTREITVADITSGTFPPVREDSSQIATAPSFMDRVRAIGSFFFGNQP